MLVYVNKCLHAPGERFILHTFIALVFAKKLFLWEEIFKCDHNTACTINIPFIKSLKTKMVQPDLRLDYSIAVCQDQIRFSASIAALSTIKKQILIANIVFIPLQWRNWSNLWTLNGSINVTDYSAKKMKHTRFI